jgi:hypothetical protein
VLGEPADPHEPDAMTRAASRLRAGTFSRRAFLGAAGTLILAGCGVEEAGKEPPTDADVLAGLLPVELAAGGAVIGSPMAELLARQDAQHARKLAELAGKTAGRPEPAAIDLETALDRKQQAVFAYVEALPRLAGADARVTVMQILAGEAEQLAALRLAAGREPVPDAFAGFLEPA